MFGKLLKHEFRATAPLILMLWCGLVLFAGLSAMFMWLSGSIDLFAIPMMFTIFFFVILAIASFVIVYVVIIRRYFTNVYGDEGYLTLTLPVSRASIIWSKLLCSCVWLILTGAVLALSAGLIAFAVNHSMFAKFLEYAEMIFADIVYFVRMPQILATLLLVATMLVELVSGILVFYAAISIGQFFTGHRLLGSVLGFLGLNTAMNLVNGIFSRVMGIPEQFGEVIAQFLGRTRLGTDMSFDLLMVMIIYIVSKIIYAALLFIFSKYIMERQVNLQ